MAILSYALCSVTDIAKQYNGGTAYSANETTVIENMINLATQYAEKYIGRHIETRGTDATQTFDIPKNTSEIFIKNFPVISVTSVTEDGTVLVLDTDYIKYDDQGTFVKGLTEGYYWANGLKKVVIVYEGGYATVPEDLQQWAIEVVGYMYETKSMGNIASERVGQLSVTYATPTALTLDDIVAQKPWLKQVLDFYKSNFITY